MTKEVKQLTEEDAEKLKAAAKARVQKKVEEKPDSEKGKPLLKRLEDKAKAPTEKELAKAQEKADKEALKKLPKEERAVKKAEKALEEAKKKLEEAKKKDNAKEIKKAEEKVKKAEEKLKKAKKAKADKEKLDLKGLAKKKKDNDEKMKKAGIEKKDPKEDKKEQGNSNANEQTKTAQKAQLASRINVDGMDIQQHGPKFVLVGKNGRETDVTDVMNEIDKYNKGVDAQNAATKAQGAVQKGVEDKAKGMNPKGQGLPTNGATGNVQVKGTPELLPSIPPVQQKAAEDITSSKLPDLKPEEKAFVAQKALQLSKLDLMKDPKAMEKLNERQKQNDEKERQKQLALQRVKQQSVTH